MIESLFTILIFCLSNINQKIKQKSYLWIGSDGSGYDHLKIEKNSLSEEILNEWNGSFFFSLKEVPLI